MQEERRVAAVPETVKKMVNDGAQVLVESDAGEGAFFKNEEYEAYGAKMISDVEKIYAEADVILKVKEPQFNENKNKHEVDMMQKGQYLIAFLHPAAPSNHNMVEKLAKKGIISLTLDGIPRISRAQSMDALTSMSTVAGYKSVILAANRLAVFMPMIGTAVGMIKPANVLVVGTGVAGLQAIATAKRLGAVVSTADIRPDDNEQAKSLGAKVIELGVPADIAVGEGGYAKKLPEEWLVKEKEALKDVVKNSNIIILSALIPGKVAPIILTEDMVKTMKVGSVIVDISIDQGGNCEITDPGNVTEKHGVSIIGTKNIPGMVPSSSTWMFANNIYNYLANLVEDGKLNINTKDEIIASSLVTIDKKIVHAGALAAMKEKENKNESINISNPFYRSDSIRL
jgi:NAD(P) transhydrogenase subunit alpha